MATLRILSGSKSGLGIELQPPEMVIGRDASCDVIISAEWMSRRHCRLVVDGERWLLEDLGSTNGVSVNNVPVHGAVVLEAGDRLSLGTLEFAFESISTAGAVLAGEDEVQRLASDTQVVTEPVWRDSSPEVGFVDVGARDVPIIRSPELDFHVALSARLMTLDEMTQGGETDLKKLARKGMLAADTAFPGRYTGRFKRVRFITLNSFDLVGRAGYTLRAGLLLPTGSGEGASGEAETDVEYRTEFSLYIPRHGGSGVLGTSLAEPQLQRTTSAVSVAEGMVDSEATRYLLTDSASSGQAGPYDVPYTDLVDGLEHLCWTCVGKQDLEEILRRLASESAGAYRAWYEERWNEKALWHDSQLPVGELRYRFDHRCTRLGRPKAIALTSVYRWL